MASHKGFIVHPTYKTRGGKSFVYLFGRLESGESFVTINEYKPYFCIKKSDLEKALGIEKFDHAAVLWKNFQEEPVVKVVLMVPSQVKPLRDKLMKAGIVCYEADIRFEYRFMFDHFLSSSMEIHGTPKKGVFTDFEFENPELKPVDYFPKNLKAFSLDIETDMKGKKLFSISIVCGDLKTVLIVSDKKLKHAENFKDEKELLLRFKEILLKEDPDIITGWNLIGFDLKILEAKFKQNGIPFNLGRLDEPSTLRITDSFFKESKAEIAGRMVLDGIAVLKNNFIALDDYKLDTAAKFFIGEEKLIGEENKGKQIEDAYHNNPQLLVDYNLKDSVLVLQILEKSTALNLTIQRSLLAGMQWTGLRQALQALTLFT